MAPSVAGVVKASTVQLSVVHCSLTNVSAILIMRQQIPIGRISISYSVLSICHTYVSSSLRDSKCTSSAARSSLSQWLCVQVLRFWCIWDDRQSMYGDRRPYVLHYFLEDDTGKRRQGVYPLSFAWFQAIVILLPHGAPAVCVNHVYTCSSSGSF